jgi:hypothetical protein
MIIVILDQNKHLTLSKSKAFLQLTPILKELFSTSVFLDKQLNSLVSYEKKQNIILLYKRAQVMVLLGAEQSFVTFKRNVNFHSFEMLERLDFKQRLFLRKKLSYKHISYFS